MTYLLGNKTCMESLSADVQDLQWTINEIISRTGPVQAHSWKFPDKKACDLDIEDLLDLYDYDDDAGDPETIQVAHIALYELVIDRLILLIQAVSKFCSDHFSAANVLVTQNTGPDSKMAGSVGLVIRQYWTQMMKLQALYHQTLSGSTSSSRKVNGLEKDSGKTHPVEVKASHTFPASANKYESFSHVETPGTLGLGTLPDPDLVLIASPTVSVQSSQLSISRDVNNKSCQTFETAFVPCESCDIIQRKLREAGDIIIKVCTDQGLPCSLTKFKSELSHVQALTFNDICRWMAEQNKDVARIGKHNEILQASIEPLKSELKSFEKRTRTAEEKAEALEKSMEEEIDSRVCLRKQYENKLKDQEKQNKELTDEHEQQKEDLRLNKEKLEKEMSKVKLELEKQRELLRDLEVNYKKLETDLQEKRRDAEKAIELAREVAELKSRLVDVTTSLESHSKTLAVEQGKRRSASRHNDSLQAKQDALLARMELLGTENENLSHQVASLEEEKAVYEDTLNELRVEVKSLRKKVKENQVHIKNLETEKRNLEKCVREAEASVQSLRSELTEAQDKEKLMVAYPDLNQPVSHDLHGTGDVAVDMQNQVKANSLRIRILDEQNKTLLQSIQKLSAARVAAEIRDHSDHNMVKLLPLWQRDSSLIQNQKNNSNLGNCDDWKLHESDSDKISSAHHLHLLGHPDHMTPTKHRQYAWTHTKKEEDGPSQEFLVSRGNTPQNLKFTEEKSLRQGRPSSAKMASLIAPVNATPVGAYIQMKKTLGALSVKDNNMKGRPPSGRSHAARAVSNIASAEMWARYGSNDSSSTANTFTCKRCEKMFLNSRDLDIHLNYCVN